MRVAVIGSGGAGMTAAWLLDERHDVTLFERNAVLGGHAHTTAVDVGGRRYYADDGFCWFSDALYPHFMRLLEVHGIATRIVRMSATFTQSARDRTFVLPPTGVGPLCRTVANVPMVVDLVRLNRAISLAAPMVHARDASMSWGEFVRQHRFPERFCHEMLTPMVAGVWGGPYDRVDDFCAYTLMKYLVFHRPSGLSRYRWHVVRDGAASYIERIGQSLSRATIRRGTGVARIDRVEGVWIVVDSRGETHTFDNVVIATGGSDARAIVGGARGLEEERRVLDGFEYYSARLATHGDPSVMPRRRSDWRVANIVWDGTRSSLNVWVGHEGGAPVFTSYIGDRVPERTHHVSTFKLPLITPAHYRSQVALSGIQGRHGLWFAGDWTRDIGSHEDAVTSALEVCEKLDPGLPRAALLRSPRVHPVLMPLPEVA